MCALPLHRKSNPGAMHNLPYVLTGGTAIGTLPIPSTITKRGIGQRGKDKQPRKPKRCKRCVDNGGQNAKVCPGRGGTIHCVYYDDSIFVFKLIYVLVFM